jgi:hypothetical protein
MDTASQQLLQQLFLKESRSLLQYVSESDPWVTKTTHCYRDLVIKVAQEEQQALAKIARHLLRHHVLPPITAGYPSNFTTINFCSIEHLLPYLIEYERKSINDLEHRHSADPEVRRMVHDYLAMKRRHLQALSEVQSGAPAAMAPAAAPAHH